jgi:RNA polymerase sigma factor (TIGR02999 family)
MAPQPEVITRLLRDWSNGDKQALDELMPLVYDQLRRLASRYLNSERPGHTLRATALVNEAYLKLANAELSLNDRAHFYAVAARLLRQILVDHARAKGSCKRGAGAEAIPIEEALLLSATPPSGILDLDDSLNRLAQQDERKSRLVELIYFGGLTYDEAAAALEISPATVHRELRLAKAWLHRDLSGN